MIWTTPSSGEKGRGGPALKNSFTQHQKPNLMFSALGIDLNITPLAQAHDAAELDLVLQDRPVRLLGVEAPPRDLKSIAGRENLAQALMLRLLTPRGSLAALGHAQYGSRIHELIGRNKTSALRDLCRKFVLEVVAQEPRVEQRAIDLAFDVEREQASSFVFTLAVRPIDDQDPVSLTLEVGL